MMNSIKQLRPGLENARFLLSSGIGHMGHFQRDQADDNEDIVPLRMLYGAYLSRNCDTLGRCTRQPIICSISWLGSRRIVHDPNKVIYTLGLGVNTMTNVICF